MTKEQNKECLEIGRELFALRLRIGRFMETFPRGTVNAEVLLIHVLEPLREVDSQITNLE